MSGLRLSGPLPRPGILAIEPYVGGESKIDGAQRIIKLSSNEGALGASPRARAAFAAAAVDLHRYPDGHHARLRAALAEHEGLDRSRIVCGNGSDDLLQLLARAYAGAGDEVLYSRHGFLIYPIAALSAGATPVAAPEVDYTASVDALIAAMTPRTRMVFLANPNNPTGTYLADTEIRRLHRALPADCLLVIDAAYAEFVDASDYAVGTRLVDEFDNVVVTRTFSKIYGMGGARLGWAYCPAAVTDVLNRVRGPFNVSGPALVAGEAALADVEFRRAAFEHNLRWRAWLAEQLSANRLSVVPSVGNFLLVRFADHADAMAADAYLRRQGIIVRAVAAYGLPECLRITIGLEDEVRAAAAALAAFRSL